MDYSGKNVRKMTSRELLEYARLVKEQDSTWNHVDWDEVELESGPGGTDCETEIKIVTVHPVWKELLEVQRKEPLSCDVNIIADGGYVPCHRVFLKEKSKFLEDLISENVKVNMPGKDNIICITLMDVNLDHLKLVMTLLYTGTCLVADSDEEDEVKDLLRLLQIDKKVKCTREKVDLKSKKKKSKAVKVLRFQEKTDEQPNIEVAGNVRNVAPVTMVAHNSKVQNTHSSTLPSGPPTTAASNNATVPANATIAEGTTNPTKSSDKAHRSIDNQTALNSKTKLNKEDEDDSGEDVSDRVPNPEYRKVAPGTLLPLNKQPRIVRNLPSTRGGGRRGKRSSKRKGGNRKQTNTNAPITIDDEDSNDLKKGKYEQDFEYVPSGGEGQNEEEDEIDNEEINLHSEDDRTRPQTRNSVPKVVETMNSRYPRRQRCPASSNMSDDIQQTDIDADKNCNVENILIEAPDAPKAPRTRRKGMSPARVNEKTGSTRSSNTNEDEGHRCTFCRDSFVELIDLRTHMETACAKHLTHTYDLDTKFCVTCKSFFKKYNACDFMDHVKICVCSAKPSQKGRRISGATNSNQSSPVKSAQLSTLEQQSDLTSNKDKNECVKVQVDEVHSMTLDVLGCTKISLFVDKLNDGQITTIMDKIQRREVLSIYRPDCPGGYRYVFEDDDESVKKKTDIPSALSKNSEPLECTSACPPGTQRSLNHNTDLSPSGVAIEPTAVTFESLNANVSKSKINQPDKTAKMRPAPLSVKRKIAAALAQTDNDQRIEEHNVEIKKLRANTEDKNEPVQVHSRCDDSLEVVSEPNKTNKVTETAMKLRKNLKKQLHSRSTYDTSKIAEDSTVRPKVATSSNNSNTSANSSTPPGSDTQSQSNLNNEALNIVEKSAVTANSDANTTANKRKKPKILSCGTTARGTIQLNNEENRSQQGINPSDEVQKRGKTVTLGHLLGTMIDNAIQNHDVAASSLQGAARSAEQYNQRQQPNSELPMTNLGSNTSAAPVVSQLQPLQQNHTSLAGPVATASSLYPERSTSSLSSITQLSAVIGQTQTRPRLSPPSAPQRPKNHNHHTGSGQRQYLTNTVTQFQPSNAPVAVPERQIRPSAPTLHNNVPSQSNHVQPQTFPPLGLRGPTPGVQQVTSQCTIETVISNQFSNQQHHIQHSRTLAVAPVSHSTQSAHKESTQLPVDLQELEIRRLEVQRTMLPSNRGQPIVPYACNNGAVAQSQMYVQQNAINPQYQHPNNTHPSGQIVVQQTPFPHYTTASINISPLQSRFTPVQQGQSHHPQSMQNNNVSQLEAQQRVSHASGIYPVAPQRQIQTQITHTNDSFMTHPSLLHQQQQMRHASSQAVAIPVVPQAPGEMVRYSSSFAIQQQQQHSNQHALVPITTQQAVLGRSTQAYAAPDVTGASYRAPNIPMIQNLDTSGLPAIISSPPIATGVIGSTATVRLPVTAQMNPLANNRAAPIMPPYPDQHVRGHRLSVDGANVTSNTSIQAVTNTHMGNSEFVSTNQVVHSTIINSETSGRDGRTYTEERAITCTGCGLKFKTATSLQDHKDDGMCD